MVLQVQIGDKKLEEMQLLPLLTDYQLLHRLVQEVIIDKAFEEFEITCSEEEIQKSIGMFMQQRRLHSDVELFAWLKLFGIQPEQLPDIAVRPMMVEKYKYQRWSDNLESYFVQRKSKLDRIIYSLIRTDDPGIAQELYFRIQDDAGAFSDLARQYSKGGEAQTGGLIGPVEMSVPHPSMMQILTYAQPGVVKPPVKIGEWW